MARPKADVPYVTLHATIPTEDRDELQQLAHRKQVSVSTLVREAIQLWLLEQRDA